MLTSASPNSGRPGSFREAHEGGHFVSNIYQNQFPCAFCSDSWDSNFCHYPIQADAAKELTAGLKQHEVSDSNISAYRYACCMRWLYLKPYVPTALAGVQTSATTPIQADAAKELTAQLARHEVSDSNISAYRIICYGLDI